MTVNISGAYGLLVRHCKRTAAFLKESRAQMEEQARYLLTARKGEASEEEVNTWLSFSDDGELMSLRVAMNGGDVVRVIADLESLGIMHHEDFVVTIVGQGVADPMPAWLEEVEPGMRYRLRRSDVSPAPTDTGP